MMLDAGTIFDRNEAAFSAAMGTPGSSAAFREVYIDPMFDANIRDGQKVESAYLEAVCDYQREGFIIGFNAAIQLLIDCMPGSIRRI